MRHAREYVYICVHMGVYVCIFTCIYVCLCACVYMRVSMFTNIFLNFMFRTPTIYDLICDTSEARKRLLLLISPKV